VSLEPPTPATIGEYRKTLEALTLHQDLVRRWSRRFPVFLLVPGQSRYTVIEGPDDVDELLTQLETLTRLKSA